MVFIIFQYFIAFLNDNSSDSVANPVTEALRAFVEYVNVPDQLEEVKLHY